ncbi:hypothetical protein PCE1_004657 [Barthelona sp. PCE]
MFHKWLEQLKTGKKLSLPDVCTLTKKTVEVLLKDENIVDVKMPVSIVGDIHGQLNDLLEMFDVCGWPPHTSYIFLGDYVDRGAYSVEVACLLFVLKVLYPQRVVLLRGNHESRSVTQNYGFKQECLTKYATLLPYREFLNVFMHLPFFAIIEGCCLCLHGGISPDAQFIDQMSIWNRFRELPTDGLLSDVVWSDPVAHIEGFQKSKRGAGYLFGADVFNTFLHRNDINKVFRAHQLCAEGYRTDFDETLVTVWSAPNYCGRLDNLASVCEVDDTGKMFFNIFEARPEVGSLVEPEMAPKYLIEHFFL